MIRAATCVAITLVGAVAGAEVETDFEGEVLLATELTGGVVWPTSDQDGEGLGGGARLEQYVQLGPVFSVGLLVDFAVLGHAPRSAPAGHFYATTAAAHARVRLPELGSAEPYLQLNLGTTFLSNEYDTCATGNGPMAGLDVGLSWALTGRVRLHAALASAFTSLACADRRASDGFEDDLTRDTIAFTTVAARLGVSRAF